MLGRQVDAVREQPVVAGQTREARWGIDFSEYFGTELAGLDRMVADGLLTRDGEGIEVLPRGRFLIRNICMAFDAYLRTAATQQRFSRVI